MCSRRSAIVLLDEQKILSTPLQSIVLTNKMPRGVKRPRSQRAPLQPAPLSSDPFALPRDIGEWKERWDKLCDATVSAAVCCCICEIVCFGVPASNRGPKLPGGWTARTVRIADE